MIDIVIVSAAYGVVLGVIGAATHHASSTTNTTTNQSTAAGALVVGFIILWFLASVPAAVYYAIMNGSRRGQTVGKMALGIAVRDSFNGQPIRFWRGFGRYLITMVFALVLYIPFIIDSLAPLWDGRRQSWHDKLAHSVVIDLRP